ncbi:MAG TPA: DNA repair protein RadC [Geminicoccus sp.]|jgi:DNA repair protein RadC|uniref:JAB domain-containing protein n=1 Tax=Geminicoccus sp. TaxID=2024832 RepID=UPI002E317B0B|nr:DNA repair protein RadC [Geminicoccus sp.]HEX2525632.1 DNA repair protein RadC [Geminicoccus sp.]
MFDVDPAIRDSLRPHGLAVTRETDEAGADRFAVVGRTWAFKDRLKQLQARFDGSRKAWLLASEDALRSFAEGIGATGPGLAEAPAGDPDKGAGWGSKHYHGHRDGLRTRFAEARDEGALADYELLELLLFFSVYRRDTKPIAKALIARFGSLGGVLAAAPERYGEVFGLDPQAVDEQRRAQHDEDLRFTQILLKAVHHLMRRTLKEELKDRPLIGSWSALIDYLSVTMSHEGTEHFRLLFLDRKNILLRDEVQSRGTVDHTPLYPREVLKRCLDLDAAAIIMVHNHPSGDPTPSKADVEMNKEVVALLGAAGIEVHDHVIVGKGKHLSFRTQRLI